MMQDWFRNAKLGIFIHYGDLLRWVMCQSHGRSTTEIFLMKIT